MPIEPDYLWLNDLFDNLDGALRQRLITDFMPNPLVEAIEPFSGNPIEAVQMHLGTRVGSRNVLLYGFGQETAMQTAASGETLSDNLPISLLLIRSFEGRAGRRDDFTALNALHDGVIRCMRHQNVSPNLLGVYSYFLLSVSDLGAEAGGWGGRRLVYNIVRATDPQDNILLQPD